MRRSRNIPSPPRPPAHRSRTRPGARRVTFRLHDGPHAALAQHEICAEVANKPRELDLIPEALEQHRQVLLEQLATKLVDIRDARTRQPPPPEEPGDNAEERRQDDDQTDDNEQPPELHDAAPKTFDEDSHRVFAVETFARKHDHVYMNGTLPHIHQPLPQRIH